VWKFVLNIYRIILQFHRRSHPSFLLLTQGGTQLHIAAALGRLDECKRLVEQFGVDVNAQFRALYGVLGTPIWFAASAGRLEVCQYLIQHGARIRAETELETVVLFCPALFGHTDVCKLLLEHGAEVNADNDKVRNFYFLFLFD
jgi:ankyrin repeat protein